MTEIVNMIAGGTSNRHYTAAITWLSRINRISLCQLISDLSTNGALDAHYEASREMDGTSQG